MVDRHIAWTRIALPAGLFAFTLAAMLQLWRVRPPVAGLTGTRTYGRNASGDLTGELLLLAFEFGVVLLALQPWTPAPHPRRIGVAGLAIGAWGALRFLTGLHAPPIALPHDLLLLGLGIVLPFTALAIAGSAHD